ncbi:MotA/TolQ/ExbB proton channel family protein [Roseimicrobium gellanilyticum]|uniref:MotA/TolQ/ExbB proton channel family protein n=1 Tax=Roseimicrobium gellanilyticum TaxID=748857 RepID=A0A366HW52_9BACT|nr:MotA/TolQ/ExbB proton channel family protein [Roseimicrobium gellanilyticum]RBP47929.1 MotA/TolQ/ExbB proton channel family protein [Roseimicrobium gellanilyticum]
MNTSSSHVTGRRLAKTGAWMQLATLIGLASTVIGMTRAFETLGTAGVADPSGLSAAIGHVLWSTAAGLGIAAIGAILMGVAVLATSYREKWLFWFLIVEGVIWGAPLFPIGLFLLAVALLKRHEFFPVKLDGTTSPA